MSNKTRFYIKSIFKYLFGLSALVVFCMMGECGSLYLLFVMAVFVISALLYLSRDDKEFVKINKIFIRRVK